MPSVDRWGRDFERAPFWTGWKVAVLCTVIVLSIVAIVGVATTGSVFFQGEAAKITNPARVKAKIYDPNNTIAQVAFFHDTCNRAASQVKIVFQNTATLKADQKAAAYAKDPVKQAQAQNALEQDQQDVTGALNTLQSTAADYNSRSAQYTANVFKGTSLPYRINVPVPLPAGFVINCN